MSTARIHPECAVIDLRAEREASMARQRQKDWPSVRDSIARRIYAEWRTQRKGEVTRAAVRIEVRAQHPELSGEECADVTSAILDLHRAGWRPDRRDRTKAGRVRPGIVIDNGRFV